MDESYVCPAELERPQLSQVSDCENIPIIDLGGGDRSLIVRQVGQACRDYGFFQVINHGVSKGTVQRMQTVANEFFPLPVEEWRLSMTVLNIHLQCRPWDNSAPVCPSNPSVFKNIVSSYGIEVRQLGFRLQDLISESLALNYYPPGRQPEFTNGLPGHSDHPNNLTIILLQDSDVAGVQVLKDGKWLAVKPHPDALLIYIGDQIPALRNGKSGSVWHRTIVNADEPGLSVASFLSACGDSITIAPKLMATQVISGGVPSSYGSSQPFLALTVPALLSFLQLKFNGNDKSPFESYPVLMIIALTSFLVYCLSNDFMLRISATRHRSPGYTYFLNFCIAFLGPLSFAALISTLFSSSVSSYFFAISVVLISLSRVPLSLVTTLRNWLRVNFRHLHHWISEPAAINARPPV